jgi:hypothetical protein
MLDNLPSGGGDSAIQLIVDAIGASLVRIALAINASGMNEIVFHIAVHFAGVNLLSHLEAPDLVAHLPPLAYRMGAMGIQDLFSF